jgi:hypothetical protein
MSTTRINVLEHDGERVRLAGWFASDKARYYREATDWDGSNNLSRNTGSQWTHEELYLTAGGRWVLGAWSNVTRQGCVPQRYEFISQEAALEWLRINDHLVNEYVAEDREESGPTPLRTVRVDDALWDAVRVAARIDGRSVSEIIREALRAYVRPTVS